MSVSFGTSGLRGPASAFNLTSTRAYIFAFLDHIQCLPDQVVLVGCDLRDSSPHISELVCASIKAHGQVPYWAGTVPTPALAAAAFQRSAPAIMVTGSHIPEDYNGIKFYKPAGELLKEDEAPIKLQAEVYSTSTLPALTIEPLPTPEAAVKTAYISRYVDTFGATALSGLKIGLFEHSAVGRDLLAAIFSGLGADLVQFGRRERFVAVDTEALDPASVDTCAQEIAKHGLDAVISSDGDGDRPLLIGPDGLQINGDVLCTLCSHALGIKQVVTPLTSTSAIEQSGWFEKTVRTRIGSPYVVRAMEELDGTGLLAGFEANGGFLLGSDLPMPGGTLTALATRDAVLPLVAVLALSRHRETKLGNLLSELPPRFMKADRLKQISSARSAAFLDEVAVSSKLRYKLDKNLEPPVEVNLEDGVRFLTNDGSTIHFRASGNAPELRLYIETDEAERTEQKLREILTKLIEVLKDF